MIRFRYSLKKVSKKAFSHTAKILLSNQQTCTCHFDSRLSLINCKKSLWSIYLGYEQRFSMFQSPSECKSPRCSSWEICIHQLPALPISAPLFYISWFRHHMPKALSFCIVLISLSIHGAAIKIKKQKKTAWKHYQIQIIITTCPKICQCWPNGIIFNKAHFWGPLYYL